MRGLIQPPDRSDRGPSPKGPTVQADCSLVYHVSNSTPAVVRSARKPQAMLLRIKSIREVVT